MFGRIARAFNRSGTTQAVSLDISKAFHRVWHASLFGMMGSLHKNIQLMQGVPQESILGITFFLQYINELPDHVISNIAIYAGDTTLYSKCDQTYDLWQQLELASELEPDLKDTVD